MLFDSSEALARAFLRALEEGDVETLRAFALSKEEFRHYVWPQLPSSRPENGVPFDYGWADLHQKSDNSLRRTYARYHGKHLGFLSIRFDDKTTDYGTFLVHRDARVKVRDEDGPRALARPVRLRDGAAGEVQALQLRDRLRENRGRFASFASGARIQLNVSS